MLIELDGSAPGKMIQASLGKIHIVMMAGENGNQDNTFGSRPIVVLLHGFAGSCDVFSNRARSDYMNLIWSKGYDVLSFGLFIES